MRGRRSIQGEVPMAGQTTSGITWPDALVCPGAAPSGPSERQHGLDNVESRRAPAVTGSQRRSVDVDQRHGSRTAHGRLLIERMDAHVRSSSTTNERTPTRTISIDDHPDRRRYETTHRGEYAIHSGLTNESSSRVLPFPEHDTGQRRSVESSTPREHIPLSPATQWARCMS